MKEELENLHWKGSKLHTATQQDLTVKTQSTERIRLQELIKEKKNESLKF